MVTVTGAYSIAATTNNGFSFSDNGVFTATGLQNVVLKGTGKPVRAEVADVTVSNTVSNCKLGITVLSDTAGKAQFTYNGAPDECISYIINGDYFVGIATGVSNTVSIYVDVIKLGSYDIISNTENGLTYSCSGSFVNPGPQIVVLSAKGTPVRAEATAFIPNTGTVSCYFYINVKPLPPPAVFTLAGAPGDCSPANVNGFYILLKPLDGANTVTIKVAVAATGSYTISSNTTDGISFSASGVFTTTGLQNVTLKGSGVPQATGTYNFTPRYSASACGFNVTVQ